MTTTLYALGPLGFAQSPQTIVGRWSPGLTTPAEEWALPCAHSASEPRVWPALGGGESGPDGGGINQGPSGGTPHPQRGFSSSPLLTFWAGPRFVVGAGPGRGRTFRSTPGLYLLDASGILLVATTKNVCRRCKTSPGGRTAPVGGREPLTESRRRLRCACFCSEQIPEHREPLRTSKAHAGSHASREAFLAHCHGVFSGA